MDMITPTIKLFTSKNDNNTGIHINNLILEHNGDNDQIQGATNDIIHVLTGSIALYVLIINTSIGTMGLNAFMTPEPDPINSVNLHNSKEIRDTWATSRRE